MSRPKYLLPKDKFLDARRWNDVSHWINKSQEWAGTREKYILTPTNSSSWYLIKFPEYGVNEIFYEQFNCLLGFNLGLKYASFFRCKYQDKLGIITRSFIGKPETGSVLWEMKDFICHYSGNSELGKRFGRDKEVLKEHDIDVIYMILKQEFGEAVLPDFFRMIGFDCLIGHTDRHWENYGVLLSSIKDRVSFRFAPIYDTATSYMLGASDDKIAQLLVSGDLEQKSWYRPNFKKNTCKMTINGNLRTNHLDLYEYILTNDEYSKYIKYLIEPVNKFSLKIARYLLSNFFSELSNNRICAILKILDMRHRILLSLDK